MLWNQYGKPVMIKTLVSSYTFRGYNNPMACVKMIKPIRTMVESG